MDNKKNNNLNVSLITVCSLIPHEQHDTDHVSELIHKIKNSQFWLKPIIVEKEHNIILDGHHRFTSAKLLGLDLIPATLVEYDDARISVSAWRSGETVNRETVISAGINGKLLPIKSSKHHFHLELPECRITLDDLHLRSAA